MFYLVSIQRLIFCYNNEGSMSVLWQYHRWVTHLYHREIKNFSRFSNFWIVPVFWNNMWGQRIVRNFLCFPSFQKLDNLNPKKDREKSTIFSIFYLRKTPLQEDTDTGWINEYDLLSWLFSCRWPELFLKCPNTFKTWLPKVYTSSIFSSLHLKSYFSK